MKGKRREKREEISSELVASTAVTTMEEGPWGL